MKIDRIVFLSVGSAVELWEVHSAAPNAVIFLMISLCVCWEPTVSHRLQRGKRQSKRERDIMLSVPLHHRGRLFPSLYYGTINLGFPKKRDHTANMKYTHCVDRLIKYWLQTYMNLPHQIKAPVGGLPLICCVWCGNEFGKAAGVAPHYTLPMLFIYLFCCQVVPSHCGVSVQPQMKLCLCTLTGAMLDCTKTPPFFFILFIWQE